MTGRIVSPEEARELLDGVPQRPGSLPLALWDAAPDLAFTVEQQAKQIAAVLALVAEMKATGVAWVLAAADEIEDALGVSRD